jgi:hypothetical protein
MNAKEMFREGWIMLLQPFKFVELTKPLQKLTILYAFSEKPIIEMTLNEKGREALEELTECWNKGGQSSVLSHNTNYSRRFGEHEDDYNARMQEQYDYIFKTCTTEANYIGQVVQTYVEGTLCRFYPEEYNVISRETFEYLLSCDHREYQIEMEDPTFFEMGPIKDRLFYLRSRGIDRQMAVKMSSGEARDAVIFRPQPALLELFCRPDEIY